MTENPKHSQKTVVDWAMDESNDLVIKYINLFKQSVMEEQIKAGIQKKEYYQGMIDGLVLLKEIISH